MPLDKERGEAPGGSGEEERTTETRRSNPVYELFVLGELMSGPTYGYKLNEILNRILGPHQQLSWGTLYPLIRRLEREGLATTTTVEKRKQDFMPAERGQPRRSYVITEAGRERFFELMLQPQSHIYHPDFFAIQLTKFEYLTDEQRLSTLQHYREMVQKLRDFYLRMRPQMETRAELRPDELPFILQLIDYRIHMLTAELAWFEQSIATASKESVDRDHKS